MLRILMMLLALALAVPLAAEAQKPIKVGMPIPLSGPPALFGDPASKGAQMYVEELNAKGGVLGRKIELIIARLQGRRQRSGAGGARADPEGQRRLPGGHAHLRGGPGGLGGGQGEQDRLHRARSRRPTSSPRADKLHPYVFRIAANTTMEGRSAAEIVAKWPVTKVATIAFDYAYGQDVTKAFVEHMKKIKPSVQIVDQQWPKLGEQDYNPFINAQMAKKPEAIVSSHLGRLLRHLRQAGQGPRRVRRGEVQLPRPRRGGHARDHQVDGRRLPGRHLGQLLRRLLLGRDRGPPDYTERLSKYLKDEYPSSWAIQGYTGMQFLVEAIKKANSTDSDKVSKALLGLTIDTPIGKQTIREKDHQANRGQLYGKTVKDPKYPFAIMKPVEYVDPTKFMD